MIFFPIKKDVRKKKAGTILFFIFAFTTFFVFLFIVFPVFLFHRLHPLAVCRAYFTQ
jgi:hypothetical protein